MSDLAAIPLLRAIGWALLHSLWQGGLLALLAAGALWLARRRSAERRYAIASAALGLLVLCFLATLAWISGGGDPLPASEALFIVPVGEGQGTGGWFHRLRAVFDPWIPGLFLAWALGFSVRLAQMGWSMAWLYGPCLGSLEPPPAEWLARFETLRLHSGVRGPVRLGLSDRVDSLVVLGWLKPVVLIPAAALLSLNPVDLEALLAHELAHVRRGDFLANLVQTLAESLLFYHPAAWWLSRRIRQEREHCCDDAAVRACGDPILYASALVRLEELRIQPKLIPDLAPAASGGRLMFRIQRLLRPRPSNGTASPSAAYITALLLVAAIGGSILSARTGGGSKAMPQHAAKTTPADPLGGDATVEVVTKVPETPQSASKAATQASEPVDIKFSRILILKQPPAPPYPLEAKEARIQGTVEVILTIDAKGQVASAKAISGPEELHACAVDYAKAWTFKPAKVKGKPVPARFKLTMPFRLK